MSATVFFFTSKFKKIAKIHSCLLAFLISGSTCLKASFESTNLLDSDESDPADTDPNLILMRLGDESFEEDKPL